MRKVLLFCIVLLCCSVFAHAQEDYVVAEVAGVPIYFSQVDRAAQGLNKYLRENFMMSENWRLDYIRKHIANIALAKRAYRRLGTGSDTAVFGMHFSQQRAFAEKLRQARLSQVKVTEADYKRYYENNKDNYRVEDMDEDGMPIPKEPPEYRPYEEVKSSVEFAATRKKKDDAISDLTSETFLQENVTIFEDRILERMRAEKAALDQN